MIPVNTPNLSGREKEYLIECIDSGWISSEGPFVKRFENEFSNYIGRSHGIAVSNGSAALDVAIRALNLPKGSEVIVPSFTIISPVQSLVNEGLIPVLVDSQTDTWNMDVELIETKISKNTRAILVVHIYGLPTDMDPILELAKNYDLKIVEDAAEMHGQAYYGKKCGSFGDISTFSFYPNKHITTGEGGMILTDDDQLAQRCKELRNLCFTPARRFVHHELGWNYRMTNMQAALGVAQLEQIEKIIERKREIGDRYNQNLKGVYRLQLPLTKTSYAHNIYWVYGLVAESEELANELQYKFRELKIGTRPFFWCMHEQPVFHQMSLFNNESYPVAEKLARQGFYIPSGLGLTNDEIDHVSEALIGMLRDG
ncbi:DegT/DnrJ/EryC1/StrS family aminotransferase [Aureitalea sp. L0-47]|uniref:DegT/DnrJ/EryC1/StrS family aminotransferase n=1 Tax=Aureitalea sp. L0-47 TaxID=2816962 RepID=UPI002238EA9E|nr:DegT/DnrJ/EryC1/StrS family aminotransferase [Aureitalea sp. L0-47]MCW5519194.1 DegT/DnrJ/EryC1/StrS family aminotransferase [Aureitalea sp. L0-47]